jgi:hypothetical protein
MIRIYVRQCHSLRFEPIDNTLCPCVYNIIPLEPQESLEHPSNSRGFLGISRSYSDTLLQICRPCRVCHPRLPGLGEPNPTSPARAVRSNTASKIFYAVRWYLVTNFALLDKTSTARTASQHTSHPASRRNIMDSKPCSSYSRSSTAGSLSV